MAEDRALVSLVIASRSDETELLDAIDSFIRAGDDRFEIIASVSSTSAAAAVAGRFPSVRVVALEGRRSVPELRAAGIDAAHGDIVAMTTGWCRANTGWLNAVRQAHAGREVIVGGAIEYGGDGRLVDRAVFYCEYGRYMPGLAPAATFDLPGQNVSYPRHALERIRDLIATATWEPLWHWRLASFGFKLVRDPTRVVRMVRRFTFRGFFVERYHYSRAFAGQRVAGRPAWVRILYAAATPVLPAVLTVRFVRQILQTHGRRLALIRLIPFLVLFTIPWAAGECVGYAAGPGSSAERID